MKAKIFFFTVIVTSIISKTSTTLRGGIDAVCTRPVRSSQTITVLEHERDEGIELSNTEFITADNPTWVEEEICCSGYENKNGTCEPQCSSPCENGYCAKPNTCACNDGYQPYFRGDVSVCEPSCEEPNCVLTPASASTYSESSRMTRSAEDVNVAQNSTSGNSTTTGNQTHPCDDGYEWGKNLTCDPICKTPCKNGKCVSPDKCMCDTDFLYNSTTMVCEPVCNKTCNNGVCEGPENCVCLKGYAKLSTNSSRCQAVCDNCTNGSCTAPDTCDCNDGFVKDKTGNKTCVASCKPECINGICNSASNCTCNSDWGGVSCEEPLLCFVRHPSQSVIATTESNLQKPNTSDIVTEEPRTDLQFPACRPECRDQNGSTPVYTKNTINETYYYISINSSCNIAAADLHSSNKYQTVIGAVLGILLLGMIVSAAYWATKKLTRKSSLGRRESMERLYTDYVELN